MQSSNWLLCMFSMHALSRIQGPRYKPTMAICGDTHTHEWNIGEYDDIHHDQSISDYIEDIWFVSTSMGRSGLNRSVLKHCTLPDSEGNSCHSLKVEVEDPLTGNTGMIQSTYPHVWAPTNVYDAMEGDGHLHVFVIRGTDALLRLEWQFIRQIVTLMPPGHMYRLVWNRQANTCLYHQQRYFDGIYMPGIRASDFLIIPRLYVDDIRLFVLFRSFYILFVEFDIRGSDLTICAEYKFVSILKKILFSDDGKEIVDGFDELSISFIEIF